MSQTAFDVPWDPWPDGWRLGTATTWAAFEADGLHLPSRSGLPEHSPWSDLLGVDVRIGRYSRGRDLWEVVSPTPTPNLPISHTLELRVQLSRRDLSVELPMTGPCSWQVAFVLQDVLAALRRQRLHLLGRPGLVDGVVRDVAGRVRPWSRLLIDVDLFGLDRHIGGHGACGDVIENAIGRHA